MTIDFNVLYNIPLLIFDFFLLVIFLIFAKAVIVIATARSDDLKLERGKRNLFAALFWLFILLAISSVFYFTINVLKGPSGGENGEFPFLISSDFPPGTDIIKLGNYYFLGPLSLKNNKNIEKPAIFAALCQRNGGNYDVIFTEKTDKQDVSQNSQYDCWLDKCEGDSEKMYIGILYLNSDNFSQEKIEKIKSDLSNQLKPQCISFEGQTI